MSKLLCLIAVAIVTIASSQAKSSTHDLKCYFCDSVSQPKCETDPASIEDAVKTCRSGLGVPQTKSAVTTPQSSILENLFRSGMASARNDEIELEYRCLAIAAAPDKKRGFIRGCLPVIPLYDKVCDYVGKQLPNIESCDECSTDLCNSAFVLSSSCFLQLVSVAFVWFIVKF